MRTFTMPGNQTAAVAISCIAALVTVSACAANQQPAVPATAIPARAAATPASLSQLEKIVLQPADLPSGWKGMPHQPDPNQAAEGAALANCVGALNTDKDKVAEAYSREFDQGDASISSSAASYRSQGDLDSDMAAVHSPKLPSCYSRMWTRQLAGITPAGTTIKVTSMEITPGSAGGPGNVVATGTGTVSMQANGRQIALYLSFAFITGPLIEAEVDTYNVGSPVPATVVNPLVATVATRAAEG